MRKRQVTYPCERTFTYGLWRLEPAKYDTGVEGFLRDMRRHAMNCIVAGPLVNPGKSGMAQLQDDLARCRKHGVFTMPFFTAPEPDMPLIRRAARTFKDDPSILGWYIKDEPAPEFLPKFLAVKQMLAEVAPRQPALCLFYRPDSMADFAPHQPILLSDCYPTTYTHGGASLGPHFAVRTGEHALARGLGGFLFFGDRGILEWMDLCRAQAGPKPHWITLQVFESGNGHAVRWRQPTAPEVRLQVYLALAGGAKSINFFRYQCVTDAYANALPGLHGEHTPLWDEIGRLGWEITPLGPLFIESEVSEPLTLVASMRATPSPGNRIETRRLRSRMRNVDYIVACNNDVMVRSTAQVYVDKGFLGRRRVYDLHTLEPVMVEDLPGAAAFAVALEPGGGRVFAVCAADDFRADTATILKGRYDNDRAVLDIEIELADKSGIDVGAATAARDQAAERSAAGRQGEALRRLQQSMTALQSALREDGDLPAAREDIGHIRRALGQRAALGASPELDKLSRSFRRLLEKFWAGEASALRPDLDLLRAKLGV